MSKEKNVNKKELLTTIMIFLLSAISAGVGALILFVPAISPKVLCNIFCTCLVILGIILISKFFAGKAFQKFHDYSFALGVLLVVMGCIGFVRVVHLTKNLDTWVGFIVLCIGIFLLQCSIQLKLLKSVVWIADIILTALIMISAVITLVYWETVLEAIPEFPFWSVLVAGIINLINFPIVLIVIKTVRANAGKSVFAENTIEPAIEQETSKISGNSISDMGDTFENLSAAETISAEQPAISNVNAFNDPAADVNDETAE